jgi:hypothetical protein
MKKFLLLFSIVILCVSARSQDFSLSKATITTGTTITLTAIRESSTDHYTSITSVTTADNNPNVTITMGTVNYYTSSSNPTTIPIKVDITGSSAITVNLVISGYVTNDANNSSMQATGNANQQLQINPASAPPTTYYNVAESGTFTDQSCGTGSMGSAVTYTVAANTYSSTTSQAAANQLAINAVNANGQSYANSHGTCTAVYARLVGVPRIGDGSHVIIHFYSDQSFSTAFSIPSQITVTLTWVVYVHPGSTGDNTTENISQNYTIPAGTSLLDLGHREFVPTNPPGNSGPFSGIVQSVSLQTNNPNFTTGANAGTFANN